MMKDMFENLKPSDNILPYDGILNDYGVIFDETDADGYFQALYHSIPWRHDVVKLYGKTITTARQMAWYGEDNVAYSYSGTTHIALPWCAPLLHIKAAIEAQLAAVSPITFNACLANLYQHGGQGMAWHSDDEPSLGSQPIIASLSLGAPRKFVMRHKICHHKMALMLRHGQLIVMRGNTQSHWQHALMKTTKIDQPRINLTFRLMV